MGWTTQQVLHKLCVGGSLYNGWTPQPVLHKLCVVISLCMSSTIQQVLHKLCVRGSLCMGWNPSWFSTSYVLLEACVWTKQPSMFSTSLCMRWIPQQGFHKLYVGGSLYTVLSPQQVLHKLCVCESLGMGWTPPPQQVLHKPVFRLDQPAGSPQAMFGWKPVYGLNLSVGCQQTCVLAGSTSRVSTSYVWVETCVWVEPHTMF